VDDANDLQIEIPSFDVAAAREYDDLSALAVRQLTRLWPEVQQCQQRLWLRRLAAPFFKDFETELAGEPPTKEQLQTLAGDVTRAVIEDMMPQVQAAAERRHAAAAAEFQRRVGAAALVEPPEAPDDDA
jgi:hypothetical protein